jgi:hypothetical protein
MDYLFKAALNNGMVPQQPGYYNQNYSQQQDKLRQQLHHCTYSDEYTLINLALNLPSKELSSKCFMSIPTSIPKLSNSVTTHSIQMKEECKNGSWKSKESSKWRCGARNAKLTTI